MGEDAKQWARGDFNRRRYTVEGGGLEAAKKVELIVLVDGAKLCHVMAREPGILAFVSKPTEPGFDIEIIEASGVRYTDVRLLSGKSTEDVEEWQWDALGM
jgi:hypothetical protein